jgi:hypothetical protein
MPEALRHAPPVISVDVEDWPQSSWDRDLPITPRAADNTRRLLGLLAREGVRTTMFVLGKLAERFPELVREIDAAGHEVASHGHGHVEIFKQTRGEFAADLSAARTFGANACSACELSKPRFFDCHYSWALKLADQGFRPIRAFFSQGPAMAFPIGRWRQCGPVGGGKASSSFRSLPIEPGARTGRWAAAGISSVAARRGRKMAGTTRNERTAIRFYYHPYN